MNFLAHIFLSGNSDQIKLGNFIGDFVKGKNYLIYPGDVQKGILLHRYIDHTTDNNDIVNAGKERLKPVYKRYAGVVVDVFYDYLLANNWQYYSNVPLQDFATGFYNLLSQNHKLLPPRVQGFAPNLIASNRLASYKDIHGLEKALSLMSKYTSLPSYSKQAIEILQKCESEFHDEFNQFFPEIISLSGKYLQEAHRFTN